MKDKLYKTIIKTQKVEKLKEELKITERCLNEVSKNIEDYEQNSEQVKYPPLLEACATLYNKYNLKRIKLELEINSLEREILEFELETALKD